MDSSFQPYLLMALSNFNKNDNNSNIALIITIFLVLSNYISRVIPFSEIYDIILSYIKGNNNYISINISSHEVPVIKGYSNAVITKIIYSKTFLAILHFLSKNKELKIDSLSEILTNNSELNLPKYDNYGNRIQNDNDYMFIPINNKKIVISNKDKVDIYCEFLNLENKNDDADDKSSKDKKNISKKNNFMITLLIKKLYNNNISILQDFIEECINDYDIHLNKHNEINDKQYIYEYKNCEKVDSKLELNFF